MFEFDFTDLSEKSRGEELVGTWVAFGRYGRKEYKITEGKNGRVWFTGPDAAGGELSGSFSREGDWFEARVSTAEGIRVGRIRAAVVEEEDAVLLNFKCEGEAAWGQDILARREAPSTAWDPLLRPAELVMECTGADNLGAKDRAKLQELAEKYNPTVNVANHVDAFGFWEKCHCDDAYADPGEVLVIGPSGSDVTSPAPVVLLLLGNGHVDGREGITSCGLDVMLQNEELRGRFYIVVPKPSTRTGLVRYTGRGWEKEWNEDAVWFLLTYILVRLGPKRVDPSRLYATGISMGARGVWHLALKYGDMLAAVAPISGQCFWPNDTWTRGPLPRQDVLERLMRLPMRAYQIDVDQYAGNPLRDVEWITWGQEERRRQVNMQYSTQKVEVQIREWSFRESTGCMELWWVKGPLEGEKGTDDHRLWLWVYEKRQWGLAGFFLKYRTPENRRWDFGTKPISVDTSEEKARLEALWAQMGDATDEAEVKVAKEALVAEFYGAPASVRKLPDTQNEHE